MKEPFVILTGLSGSGKSAAIRVFEDMGYYCVDNLPLGLLPDFVEQILSRKVQLYENIAVGIDARSDADDLREFSNIMRKVKSRNRERKIEIELQPAARERLADKGYDPDFGARPLSRVIQQELKNPLTDEVLFGRLKGGGRVEVGVDDAGEFVFTFPD